MLRRTKNPSLTLPARRPDRRGFTLVELLVACALVVLILTILAVAFGAATESLGRLKGTGDMATSLRVAGDRLRADLNAPHFEAGETSPAGMRLSDLKYNLGAVPAPVGYFRIEQGQASYYEGADSDGFASTRAVNHALEFTTRREGKTADDLFTVTTATDLRQYSQVDAPAPAGGPYPLSTKWARVRWHLGNPTAKNGTTTYTLYRSVRVVLPNRGVGVNAADAGLVAVDPNFGTSVGLSDLAGTGQRATLAPGAADDIVLTDVLSFEVKPTWETRSTNVPRGPRTNLPAPVGSTAPVPPTINQPVTENNAQPSAVLNMDYPYDDLPPNFFGGVFDTNVVVATAQPIRVTGVQVKIRVFDPKHGLARQVTLQFQQ